MAELEKSPFHAIFIVLWYAANALAMQYKTNYNRALFIKTITLLLHFRGYILFTKNMKKYN